MANIKILFEKKTILLASGFAKKASNPKNAEFTELQEVKQIYPNFKTEVKHIKTNPKKECYKDLTYDYMRDYISTHDSEIASAYLEELILRTRCHSTGYRYPTVKKWFLETYPEVKNILGLAVGSLQATLPQGTSLALPEANA